MIQIILPIVCRNFCHSELTAACCVQLTIVSHSELTPTCHPEPTTTYHSGSTTTCHSELVSESKKIQNQPFIQNKMLKQVQHDSPECLCHPELGSGSHNIMFARPFRNCKRTLFKSCLAIM